MKKLLIQLIGLLFINVKAHSQQLSPSLIAAAGGISKAQGIALDWSLGEIAVEGIATSDRLYTQGFHQPILRVKNFFVNTEQLAGYNIIVAPNPVQSVLTAIINTPNDQKVYLTLVDFTGKRFRVQTVPGGTGIAKVDMSGLTAGIYLLEARNESGQLIQSYKIIKAQ